MTICEYCLNEFTAPNLRQRFCCPNHSKYAWNQKHNWKPRPDREKKRLYDQQYRVAHQEKIQVLCADWYQINKEKSAQSGKDYRENHPQRVRRINKQWKSCHQEEARTYARRRYTQDIQFKLRAVLRARLKAAIKGNCKIGSAVKDLGCPIAELKIHLESKFLSGMSWDNWGRGREKWHIDHIIPLSFFDLSDLEQLKKACHYTNLQPLWELDNLKKGDKFRSDRPVGE